MNTKVKVAYRKQLLPLIERKSLRNNIFPKLLFRLKSCEDIIDNLNNNIPINNTEWSVRNNILKSYFDIKNLAGLLCLYLLDDSDDETPQAYNKFDYTLEELQKIFIHLDKEQLKAIELKFQYRKGFNELLKKLTENDHPFGNISIDENWNIVGDNCLPIKEIEKYLFDLDNSYSKPTKEIEKDLSAKDHSEVKEQTKPVITTLWNIKKDGNLFYRYKTILSFIFGVLAFPIAFLIYLFTSSFWNIVTFSLFINLLFIISIILISIGLIYTFKYVKNSKLIMWRLIIHFIGIILIATQIILGIFAIKDEFDNSSGTNIDLYTKNAFVKDPYRLGYGITTINYEKGQANQQDSLDVSLLKINKTLFFKVFIDYQNATNKTLTNVKSRVYYSKSGNSKKTIITGDLLANQGLSVADQTHIINLPKSWKIDLISAHCINTHPDSLCPDYAYYKKLNINALNKHSSLSLPNLDAFGISSSNHISGACSQGHVIALFKLTNTSK